MKIDVVNSAGEIRKIVAQVVRDCDLVTTVLVPFLMDGTKAVAFGRAFRCALDKQPNKKLARTIALGRALKVIDNSMGPGRIDLCIPMCGRTLSQAYERYGKIFLNFPDQVEGLRSGGLCFVGDPDAFGHMSATEIMAGGEIKDDRFTEL